MPIGENLNEQQIKFCEEYVVDYNATQAAIRAGYSKNSASSIGSQLLGKLNVRAHIEALKKKTADKLDITKERVLKEYARIAFFNIRNAFTEEGKLIPIHELDEDTAAAIAAFDLEEIYGMANGEMGHIGDRKKTKYHSKTQALEALAKYLGIFETDNKQRQSNVSILKMDDDDLVALEKIMKKQNGDTNGPGTVS